MAPDLDLLAFLPGPVPVRKQVNHWLPTRHLGPPGLVIEKIILRKAADIHDAEVRVDAGPAVGRGLAPIIEAGPRKTARHEWTRVVDAPPIFRRGRPGWIVDVVGADVALHFVVRVNAARRHRARGLRAHHGLPG